MNSDYLALHEHFLEVPYMKEKRRVRVLLPSNYESETTHYPVVYMHDGQNIFFSRESYSGYSWELIPLLKKSEILPPVIIVGIDNSEEKRFDEYMPWEIKVESEEQSISAGGMGKDYAKWLVETVKPFIDTHYRTKKEHKDTILAGSSLGAVITAYTGAAYPDTFGALGIFSLASWLCEEAFINHLAANPINSKSKVYIQSGTNEGNEEDQMLTTKDTDQAYIDSSIRYYNTLLENGHDLDRLSLRIFSGEYHFEKYWADHFGEFLAFAFNVE
ncbi:esterase [Tetragenococcus halophilus subsp. flandriensis]|uniref:alpha/beta hydrolase n=1 Tax=Tetragenococcus halophilus TaxID=51669 RepID=UPI0023EA0686|nr:alpha/beta hydrolase-fold protein [Tetragenococcus halophilus]GMA07536.1 esterase [Tetragenococcus halophilus subsp. flandriensis]